MAIKKALSLLGRGTSIHRRSLFAITPSMNMNILTHGTASATEGIFAEVRS